jgi:hypothetical protein
MAFGSEPLGLVYFAAIKFAGYSAAAYYIKKRIPGATSSPWFIGATRTVIGLLVGIGAAFLAESLGILKSELAWYALLAPLRLLEWLALLWLFFRRFNWSWARSLKLAALGSLWSYILDIPAVLAVFVVPGGAWIC